MQRTALLNISDTDLKHDLRAELSYSGRHHAYQIPICSFYGSAFKNDAGYSMLWVLFPKDEPTPAFCISQSPLQLGWGHITQLTSGL